MKKIFAILCSATMLFAACSKEETPNEVTPIFPETQTFEVLAGESRGVPFNANMAWSVSLENDYYATLTYGDKTGVEVSGEAGDDIRVFVQVKENLKNYDADIVIPVAITMGNETKTLATFTIKQIERPDAIVLNEELFPTMTFEKGGHPSWGGEFESAKEKYHLNYSDKWDVEGISMSCNLDGEYSIKVYAYNQTQSISDATTITEPWVSVFTFGQNKFKVLMDLTKQSAEWSWFGSQYESYVNFEDAEGNVLVSIFCTCTYKESSTGGATEAPISLFSENASMMQVTLEDNGDNNYTLTLGMLDLLTMPSYTMYAALKVPDYNMGYFAQENLTLVEAEDTDSGMGKYYYVSLAENATPETLVRENNLTIYTMGDAGFQTYNITVILDWIEPTTTPEE